MNGPLDLPAPPPRQDAQPVAWMSGEGKTIQAIVEHAAQADWAQPGRWHAWRTSSCAATTLHTQDRLITYLLGMARATGRPPRWRPPS